MCIALPSEGRGHRFESCRVHHFSYTYQQINALLLLQCSKVLTLLQSVVKFYIESKVAQAQNLTEKIVIQTKKHRSVPIAASKIYINGYPKKLVLFQQSASPFYWVRYYTDGKMLKRSTKTESKQEAIEFAKTFYDEINLKRALKQSLTKSNSFYAISQALLKAMEAQVARKELTKTTFQNNQYRLNKHILPFFGTKEITDIHFDDLDSFLNTLSVQQPPLSSSTISGYMKIVKRVFTYALQRQNIEYIPAFPSVKGEHNARGYFNLKEYRQLWSRARKLEGQRFEYRVLKDKNGVEQTGSYFPEGTCYDGRLIRKVTITRELVELIVFMTNSFIRPTDIKNMQHKHIEEDERDGYKYLRLTLPTSKKHDKPIVTQQMAIEVYNRLTAYNKQQGWGIGANDYVFFPNASTRDYALKILQTQFDALLTNLDISQGLNGEKRTIYSLRHTCIMYRLLYGEDIDVISLARNARTSQEMIDRFYASQLTGEDNIGMLQSRRKRGKNK